MENKIIRILYTIPNFNTAGSGIALMKLIGRLDPDRFEPHIMCVHDRGDYFKDVVANSGIPIHIYKYTGKVRPYLKAIVRIIKLALYFKRNKFDIVFSYHYAADYIEAIAAKLAGARFIYVKKNMSWHGPSYRAWKLKTFFSDKVLVQNTDMIKDFYNNNNKASLVSIGVDMSEFYPRPKDLELLKEFNINDNDKIILCVAHIVPNKGIDVLIKAFGRIEESQSNVRLLIVGEDKNEFGTQLKHLVEEEQIKSITFTGKRFDMYRFYSIADLFVLPSTGDEGAPIVNQEAMASGVPILSTNRTGSRDQLSELPDQIVEPGNSDELFDKINKNLFISKKNREAIIKKQLDIINKHYSLYNEVKQHEQIYSGFFFNVEQN